MPLGRARDAPGSAGVTIGARARNDAAVSYPKIELDVHLEGTVRAGTLLRIARRNDVALPADSVEGLAGLYEFRDFSHFIEIWALTTRALRSDRDFRQVVVDYAGEAAGHGAVYLEGIFSPAEPVSRGSSWDEVFAGYCDGAQEARQAHGVRVALTPDIPRGLPLEAAELTARYAVAYRDRGVVGLGLGGLEAEFPPEPFSAAFAVARDGGLGSVPHAGEVAGPASIRGALDALGAGRIRHGIRAVDDPGLVAEIASRGIVLDVCPISNLRTGAVAALAEHPLPALVAAGVHCSISTDDPAMFSTDLAADYAAAQELGASPLACFQAGLQGARCATMTPAPPCARPAMRSTGQAPEPLRWIRVSERTGAGKRPGHPSGAGRRPGPDALRGRRPELDQRARAASRRRPAAGARRAAGRPAAARRAVRPGARCRLRPGNPGAAPGQGGT
jgi:aminodeoxyfutalosine deaminase